MFFHFLAEYGPVSVLAVLLLQNYSFILLMKLNLAHFQS